MAKFKRLPQVDKILRAMPIWDQTYSDHAMGHVSRIFERLEEMSGYVRPALSAYEARVLSFAVELHDIGLSNPKTRNRTEYGEPNNEQLRAIKDEHEIISADFVMDNWEGLGISDHWEAGLVARLCRSHRKKNYVSGDALFPHEKEGSGRRDVRVQLLSSLLKLADALDVDSRRASQAKTDYFLDLLKEDKWHWDAFRCINIVRLEKASIFLQATIPPPDSSGSDDFRQLVIDKAIAIFDELILVLPFLIKAKLPWVMVAGSIRDDRTGEVEAFRVWETWWSVRAGSMGYSSLKDLAKGLCSCIRPVIMPVDDMYAALKAIQAGDYPVPPGSPPDRGFEIKTFETITGNDECKQSFVSALSEARQRIEIMASDLMTHWEDVWSVLKKKVRKGVKVTVFVLRPELLQQIEGTKEELSAKDARQKSREAREALRKWWAAVVKGADRRKKRKLRECMEIIVISSAKFAHLRGSAIIDSTLLRINVHPSGESSSRGMLLEYPQPMNLLYIVQRYVADMRRYGRKLSMNEFLKQRP